MEKLRKAIRDHHLAAEFEHCPGVRVITEPEIDLIDQSKTGASPNHLKHRFEFGKRHRGAGWIGRGRGQYPSSFGAPMTINQVCRQLKAGFSTNLDRPRDTVVGRDKISIAGVGRIGHQHLGTGIDQRSTGQIQGSGSTRRHHDPFRRHVDLPALGVVGRDRLAQSRCAQGRRVLGNAAACGTLQCGDHGLGRGEVRFPDG